MENIYTTFNRELYRATDDLQEATFKTIGNEIDPFNISSGASVGFTEIASGGIRQGKNAFSNAETGFILGIENGLAKFYIGNTTDYLNWDGDTLSIAGTFRIGGTIITISDIDDLQPTINEVDSLGGGTVAFVPGNYTGTTVYTVPSGVTIDGNGSTIDFGSGTYQFSCQGTLIYSTGTLSVNVDSASVTGVGTSWTSAMNGKSILLQGGWYVIDTVSSTTTLTLVSAFSGVRNLSGSTYVIADYVSNVNIVNLTLTNSTASTGTVYFRYANVVSIDKCNHFDSTRGWTIQDSSVPVIRDNVIANCTTGSNLNQVGFANYDSFSVLDTSGGDGITCSKFFNSQIINFVTNNATGIGLKMSDSSDIGIINFSCSANGSHGFEFTNVDNVGTTVATINDNGGDGFKFVSGCDGNHFVIGNVFDNGGYGVNIAAASDNKNTISLIDFDNNSSGSINDSGTGSIIVPDDTAYGSSWNGNLGAPTKNAVYDEMELRMPKAGGTFSGDIVVPAEAYGVGWNGSNEAPTKNDVYDKIETLSITSTSTSNVGTVPSSSSTQTITHGLGRTPVIIRIYGLGRMASDASARTTPLSFGVYDSSGNRYIKVIGAASNGTSSSTSASVYTDDDLAGANGSGVIQNVGATTFDIVWTVSGDPSNCVYLWEAQ